MARRLAPRRGSRPSAARAGRTRNGSAAATGTRAEASARRCPSSVERTAVRGAENSYGLEADPDLLARRGAEQLGRVPAADREGDVPVRVLVEDQVGVAGSGEGSRRGRGG